MKNFAFNFLLVMLIEAVSAVVTYLKERLTGILCRSGDEDCWSNHPEFV